MLTLVDPVPATLVKCAEVKIAELVVKSDGGVDRFLGTDPKYLI